MAQQELGRSQSLFKHGFVSAQAIDQLQSRMGTGNAAVTAARAQVSAVSAGIGAAQAQVAETMRQIRLREGEGQPADELRQKLAEQLERLNRP